MEKRGNYIIPDLEEKVTAYKECHKAHRPEANVGIKYTDKMQHKYCAKFEKEIKSERDRVFEEDGMKAGMIINYLYFAIILTNEDDHQMEK